MFGGALGLRMGVRFEPSYIDGRKEDKWEGKSEVRALRKMV